MGVRNIDKGKNSFSLVFIKTWGGKSIKSGENSNIHVGVVNGFA